MELMSIEEFLKDIGSGSKVYEQRENNVKRSERKERLSWIVVPEVVPRERDSLADIARYLDSDMPDYAVFIDTVSDRFNRPALAFKFYRLEGEEIYQISVADMMRDIQNSGHKVWVIYNSSNTYTPYFIKEAWKKALSGQQNVVEVHLSKARGFLDMFKRVLPEESLQRFVISAVMQEAWQYYDPDKFNFINAVVVAQSVHPETEVLFISDQFPPYGEDVYFDVKVYYEFPRRDLVLGSHLKDAFDRNTLPEIREAIKKAIVDYLDKDEEFVVTDTVKEVLDVVISYLFVDVPVSPALGKILLIGPPGTGKTTFAKKIGQALFGTDEVFDRVDMNAFSGTANDREALRVFLIGSSGEYRASEFARGPVMKLWGYRRGVILWDEIDKAGNETSKGDILNFLMQVLEEDRLQMAFGGFVPIYNFVHIFTANRVASYNRPMGLAQKYTTRDEYMESIKNFLPEAFLSRIDAIIYYGYPTLQELHAIAEKLVNSTLTKWIVEKDHEIKRKMLDYVFRKIDENLVDEQETGVTPRMIKRWIREYIIRGM